jgi:hypothetical protein
VDPELDDYDDGYYEYYDFGEPELDLRLCKGCDEYARQVGLLC